MIKKRFLTVLLVLIMVFSQMIIFPATADSASISMPSTAYLGDTITVKVTFECTHGSNKIGSLDAELGISPESAVELVSTTLPSDGISDTNYKNGKYIMSYANQNSASSKCVFTFKFKTKKAETVGMHVTAEITDTDTTKTINKEYNTSIKVVDKSTLSGNAKASKIVLSAGTLVPSFSPDVTSYNVNVDYSVTEVLLSITTQEANAQIVVEGSKTMKVGANTRTVVITAPNGTEKRYKINIYRASSGEDVKDPEPPLTEPDVNPYEITVDGKKIAAVSDYTNVVAPYGFSPATHTINDAEIPVLKDVVSGRVIVYAADSEGNNGIYALYNEEEKTFTQFKYMEAENFKFIVLDYTDTVPTLKDYFYTAVNVGEFSVNGFKYNDNAMSDFVIFYAETLDGAKGFYRYDIKDKTVQRAVEFAAKYQDALNTTEADGENVVDRFIDLELKNKIIVTSGIVAILIIVLLVVIIIVRTVRKTPNAESIEAAKEQEFMEGFGENNHLFLDDDSDLDDDFKFKDDSDN